MIDAIEEMGPNKAFQVITKIIHVCKRVRKIVREEMFPHITYSSCELHMFTWLMLKDDINSLHFVSMFVQNVGTMVQFIINHHHNQGWVFEYGLIRRSFWTILTCWEDIGTNISYNFRKNFKSSNTFGTNGE